MSDVKSEEKVKEETTPPTVAKQEEKDSTVKTEVAQSAATKEEKKEPTAKKEEKVTAKKEEKKKMDESSSDDSDDSSSSGDESDVPLGSMNIAVKSSPKKKKAPPAKKTAAKSSPTKRKAPTKPAAKKRAPPKKRVKKEESSSDDSDSNSSSDSSDSDSSDSSDSDSSSDDDNTALSSRMRKKRTPRERKTTHKRGTMDSQRIPFENFETRPKTPLVATKGANKWWTRDDGPDGDQKWTSLEHNGPTFPPEYEKIDIPLVYDGDELILSKDAEEVAVMYAVMLDHEYASNPVFNKNFFRDWRGKMSLEEKKKITDLTKCDFKPLNAYLMTAREKKKELQKQPDIKIINKAAKEESMKVYGFALVDGYLEKNGNFRVEPPGLFRGRGAHPKTGTLKRRVKAEDITLNIGEGVAIPEPPTGHKWKGIVHNSTKTWLATWVDNVNGDSKYVHLAASSRFKCESDMGKFAKAQKLKHYIKTIREDYRRDLTSKSTDVRQRATACYVVDILALRVGNEKDLSERADTVGLCSLRVEHVQFKEEGKIHLHFLGKDSMVYDNTCDVPIQVWQNMKDFTVAKKPNEDLFDTLTPALLNTHLSKLMPGLSAKVFRTYNASVTLEKELWEGEGAVTKDDEEGAKMLFYNRANREVAILCNHQRTVPKGYDGQMENMQEKLEGYEQLLADLTNHLKVLKGKKKPPKKAPKTKMPTSADACKNKMTKTQTLIDNFKTKMQLKSDTKTVALGTSKINYMDPRITVAWCKAVDLPIEKVFNTSLLGKFPWALEVKTTWKF